MSALDTLPIGPAGAPLDMGHVEAGCVTPDELAEIIRRALKHHTNVAQALAMTHTDAVTRAQILYRENIIAVLSETLQTLAAHTGAVVS